MLRRTLEDADPEERMETSRSLSGAPFQFAQASWEDRTEGKAMASLPTGTVTFLFTDIEGSTRLLQRLGDRYAELQSTCHELVRSAIEQHAGHVLGIYGDGLAAVFELASSSLMAAVAAQRSLAAHPWPPDAVFGVRMGLHTGEARLAETGYVGVDVNCAARIGEAGYGGQILVSEAAHGLLTTDLEKGTTLRFLGQIRAKDFTQPLRVFQVVAPGLVDGFPPLKSLDTLPNNLPRQLTSFVGREQETADVKQLLARGSLVTLTGIGGAGKTRLALRVAADLLEAYPDGIWLVELAPLVDPTLVPQAVAVAVGVREEPGRPLRDTLVDFVRARAVLLVLDNCEHLLSSCAQLAHALLRSCPRLRVLATSREPLGVPGEVVWRIPSLSLPDPRSVQSLEDLAHCEAVRLFVERATLTLPGFALTPHNAAAVAQVCTRLDGIPLAIELAAAPVSALTVQQIAARLDDRFRLLAGGSRTSLPRHQTLRAAMDWSYDLLAEKERALLSRLSVFAGGWTPEAAEAVCEGEGVESAEILDLLARLVVKSLVVMEARGDQARYRLLETIRQYGRDRLDESGETERVRCRHLTWYLSLVERRVEPLSGPDESTWLDRLEEERDNLRAALELCRTMENTGDAGLRIARALWQFWSMRGDFNEGRRWLETMLSRCRTVPASVRAHALVGTAFLAYRQDDYAGSVRLCEESFALFRDLNDLSGMGRSQYLLGVVAEYQGDYERAKALLMESLALGRQAGDKRRIALSLISLGEVARCQGDYVAAPAFYEESLVLAREIGDKRAITSALGNLGHVALYQGRSERATQLFNESLRLAQQLGHKVAIAEYLAGFAGVAASEGRHECAARLLGAAGSLLSVLGTSLAPADQIEYQSTMRTVRSALDEGTFKEAWDAGSGMLLDEAIEYALAGKSS